ncbi:MAG: hypothetical protein ACJ8C4_11895 [Gemmataceae bacterium]
MKRIFTTLAITDSIALAAAFALGCWSRWAEQPSTNLYLLHFLVGLFTAVGTILVHCLIFTYLLGTGRWVREVTLAYQLPDEPNYRRTRDLKRQTYPLALTAMLLTIAAAAAGGGAQLQGWPWQIHFALSITTLVVNYTIFAIEYRKICINTATLDAVLVDVDRVRAARGLPPNATALAEEAV